MHIIGKLVSGRRDVEMMNSIIPHKKAQLAHYLPPEFRQNVGILAE
jgi:hypothetical protein